MGISVAYGILFATFITLLLIPVNIMIADDIGNALRRYWQWGLANSADDSEDSNQAAAVSDRSTSAV
ncbi:MAG: hypothetical protein AAGF46_07335, partial [Pseudomonadota bacterium]